MVHEPRTPPPENIQRITPGEIRHCLQLVHPFATVTVRGMVVELRGWPADAPKFAYGKLRELEGDDGAVVDFRCPVHQAPRVLQQVVEITGTLYPEIGPHDITVSVRGHCRVVDQRQLAATPPKTWIRERSDRVRLSTLIEEGNVERIAVIGTSAAHADILRALDHPQAGDRLPLFAARVAQVDDLLLQLQRAKQERFDACLFAQSGSETALNAWYSERLVEQFGAIGVPVYTALAHANAITPADHYADESFATPSAFGAALKAAIDRVAQRQELISARNDALALHEKVLTELRISRESFDEKLQAAQREARRKARRATTGGILTGAVIAAVAIWALQQPWAEQLLRQYLP